MTYRHTTTRDPIGDITECTANCEGCEMERRDKLLAKLDTAKLNPGIAKTVRWLAQQGFRPMDSGDGATHDFPCDRDHAYVVLRSTRASLCADADRLAALLAERGVVVGPLSPEGREPYVQASYSPNGGMYEAVIDLQNVTDSMLGL
jgi:hypothetical protein